MKMFKRIKIAIAIAISFDKRERGREEKGRERRQARPEPAVARAKDFYALLSHFRVYIVNWLTSNDEGEGRERELNGNGPELRPESYLVRADWLAWPGLLGLGLGIGLV